MATLFISDLHLQESRPDLTRLFFDLIHRYESQMEALYILGDLFEVWIGDDDLTPFHLSLIHALQTLTQRGISVYFLPGNRDFLIGKAFCKLSGCTLLPDPCLIDLYGERVLLTHGDHLCSLDTTHLRFRKLIRSNLIKKILLALPLTWRKKIACYLREKSKQHTLNLNKIYMDAPIATIQALFETTQHRVTTIIHGHTHRPSIELFFKNEDHQTRIVLSDWETKGNVLICNPKEKRLVYES